jgi:hypothetical protein
MVGDTVELGKIDDAVEHAHQSAGQEGEQECHNQAAQCLQEEKPASGKPL